MSLSSSDAFLAALRLCFITLASTSEDLDSGEDILYPVAAHVPGVLTGRFFHKYIVISPMFILCTEPSVFC